MPFFVPSRYLGGTEVEHGYGFSPDLAKHYPGLTRSNVLNLIVRQVLQETRRSDNSTSGWLRNGARLYIDLGEHPEYSTAETRDPYETALHEHAGALCLQRSIDQLQQKFGAPKAPIHLYRDNVDSAGNAYANHENQLVWRDVPVESLQAYFTTYLVARMPFFGAGRFALADEPDSTVPFRITQRGEFFEFKTGSQSTRNRPLFHTRDEPHALSRLFRRVHVLPGDTNFCETTTALKNGTTAAALALVECGMAPDIVLIDSIGAKLKVDRDRTLRTPLDTNKGSMTALNIMEQYIDATESMLDRFGYECLGGRKAGENVMDLFVSTFDALSHFRDHGTDKTEGVVNWLTKLSMGEQLVEEEKIDVSSMVVENIDQEPVAKALRRLRTIELALHGITKRNEVFRTKKGIPSLFSQEQSERALVEPPPGTRASIRTDAINLYGGNAVIDWSKVKTPRSGRRLAGDATDHILHFKTPFFPTESAIEARKARGLKGRRLLEDLCEASNRLVESPSSGPVELPSPPSTPPLTPERRAELIAEAGIEI